MAMGNPICWFEIYVDDIERAKKFYEDVFETTLNKLDSPATMNNAPEMWAFPSDMEQHGATGAIAKMEGVAAGDNSTLVYFSCEDCAVEAGRVEASGGKLMQPKFSIGEYGWIAIASDTEGNTIGLHSMK